METRVFKPKTVNGSLLNVDVSELRSALHKIRSLCQEEGNLGLIEAICVKALRGQDIGGNEIEGLLLSQQQTGH